MSDNSLSPRERRGLILFTALLLLVTLLLSLRGCGDAPVEAHGVPADTLKVSVDTIIPQRDVRPRHERRQRRPGPSDPSYRNPLDEPLNRPR